MTEPAPATPPAKEAAFRAWRKTAYHLVGTAQAQDELQKILGASVHLREFKSLLGSIGSTHAASKLTMSDFEAWLNRRLHDYSLSNR